MREKAAADRHTRCWFCWGSNYRVTAGNQAHRYSRQIRHTGTAGNQAHRYSRQIRHTGTAGKADTPDSREKTEEWVKKLGKSGSSESEK
jgi:hypothetical protein